MNLHVGLLGSNSSWWLYIRSQNRVMSKMHVWPGRVELRINFAILKTLKQLQRPAFESKSVFCGKTVSLV